MRDIVIPLGKGSIWYDNELRFCLRSIENFCDRFGDVYIVGEKPSWLCNVNHLPFEEFYGHELNIWHKVVHACKTESISDDFLFVNDDFFFLESFTTSYPYYHGGSMKDYVRRNGNNDYSDLVNKTRRLLEDNELPSMFFDVHRPMLFNKADFLEMYRFFHPRTELVMKSCYANYHKIEGIVGSDLKIAVNYAPILDEMLKNADMFSIYDSLCGKYLKDFLTKKFPKPSKYEN